MSRKPADFTGANEVAILGRILTDPKGRLSTALARHILTLGFNDEEKARMHDLAVRNQESALSDDEKEELVAYAKAGTLLSLWKSKARRTLRGRSRKDTHS